MSAYEQRGDEPREGAVLPDDDLCHLGPHREHRVSRARSVCPRHRHVPRTAGIMPAIRGSQCGPPRPRVPLATECLRSRRRRAREHAGDLVPIDTGALRREVHDDVRAGGRADAETADELTVQVHAQPHGRGFRLSRLLQQIADGNDELGGHDLHGRHFGDRLAEPPCPPEREHDERDQELAEGEPHAGRDEIGQRLVALARGGIRALEEHDPGALRRNEDVRGERGVVLGVQAIVHERARASRGDDPAVALWLCDHERAVSAVKHDCAASARS